MTEGGSMSDLMKRVEEAMEPFAKVACDEPHVDEPVCYNCELRAVLTELRAATVVEGCLFEMIPDHLWKFRRPPIAEQEVPAILVIPGEVP